MELVGYLSASGVGGRPWPGYVVLRDALSGGRVELGVANGGSAPGLAELFRGAATGMDRAPGGGIDPASRRAVYRGNLARLADALDGARLSASGDQLNPPSPGLAGRIWEATLSEQSGYDTGARGNGVLIGTTQTVPAEVTARAALGWADAPQALPIG